MCYGFIFSEAALLTNNFRTLKFVDVPMISSLVLLYAVQLRVSQARLLPISGAKLCLQVTYSIENATDSGQRTRPQLAAVGGVARVKILRNLAQPILADRGGNWRE